ncbi:MAG: RnfABCDGE type electron transport complex subunit G [Clostridia bacterium]|nr:RnfABCDGE type electron transport complex subunit G [Clostridia bacterium]
MSTFKTVVLPPLVLTVICALIALMLGFVHSVTAAPIAEAEERAKTEAVYSIFPEAAQISPIDIPEDADPQIKAMYKVKSAVGFAGYAVNVTVGSGYGGEINMTVGIDTGNSVKGLEIVSHSETAGLGARIDEPAFRQGFNGITEEAVIGGNVDAISGATISSKAVAAGVNAALDAVAPLFEVQIPDVRINFIKWEVIS